MSVTPPNLNRRRLPATRRPRVAPATLPTPLSSFVGREAELAEITALLRRDGVRLVTLTGPGGVGKTRLALRLAHELGSDFPGGRWFVPLAPLSQPELLAAAILERLGPAVPPGGTPEERVTRYLARRRNSLLVLDNLEQLLPAATVVSGLLATCPSLRVLATSREPLRVTGEHVYVVPQLTMPPRVDDDALESAKASDAVRLFVERATAANNHFLLTPENAAAIIAICAQLDGLPLGIELAAARTGAFSPASLLDRLESRLPFLRGGPVDAPARHRTMRDAIAWSYDLLPAAEQRCFRRLAVFRGGFSLDAAGTLLVEPIQAPNTVTELVTSLVAKNMVRPSSDAMSGRFSMLETIREFGIERLVESGEERAIRDAHAAWVLEFALQAHPELLGPNQAAWSALLTTELGNIRAAIEWRRAQNEPVEALRLVDALGWFWMSPGRFEEGRDLYAALLEQPGVDANLALYGNALHSAGGLDHWLDDFERALDRYERARQIYVELGDRWGVAVSFRGMGSVSIELGRPERAAAYLETALREFEAVRAPWDIAHAHHLLGLTALALDRMQNAVDHQTTAMHIWRDLGDTGYTVTALAHLGIAQAMLGHYAEARDALQAAFAIAPAAGDVVSTLSALDGAALLAASMDDGDAGTLLAAADAHLAVQGYTRRPPVQAAIDRGWARVRASNEQATRDTAHLEARAISLRSTIALARGFLDRVAPETSLAPNAGTTGPPLPLSPRQFEVLQLLASGLSDFEIAERLSISRRTASNHVAAVLAALDVPTRGKAAAAAVRFGILPRPTASQES